MIRAAIAKFKLALFRIHSNLRSIFISLCSKTLCWAVLLWNALNSKYAHKGYDNEK